MIKFEKVSFEQFYKDCLALDMQIDEQSAKWVWDNIKLPKRSTVKSAGYDFYMPFATIVHQIEPKVDVDNFEAELIYNEVTVPTGIRFINDTATNLALFCIPRSGLGFKNGLRLMNTVGLIDSDYWMSDNEGEIMVRFTVDKSVLLDAGKAFMQGVIVPYYVVDDDNTTGIRNGGFGSTDKQ